MKTLSKQEVENGITQLWDESKNDTIEQELEDEKRTSLKITVKRALDYLYQLKVKHILDKTSNLTITEIKEFSRMESVDGLLKSFYGSKIYDKYFTDYKTLKISNKGKGRDDMLNFVGSMKKAEEEESILKHLGLVQRNSGRL